MEEQQNIILEQNDSIDGFNEEKQSPSMSPSREKYISRKKLMSQLSIYNEDPVQKMKAQQQLKGSSVGIYTDFFINIKLQKHIRKFANSFLTVFVKKQKEEFIKLQMSADELMAKLDKKVYETLVLKEASMVTHFEKQLKQMVRQLNESQQKCNELIDEIKKNNKINILEKQLQFFKEQCFSLNQIKTEQSEQIKTFKNDNELLEFENDIQQKTLINLEKENQQIKKQVLFYQQQYKQVPLMNQIYNFNQNQNAAVKTQTNNNNHQQNMYNYEIQEEPQNMPNSVESLALQNNNNQNKIIQDKNQTPNNNNNEENNFNSKDSIIEEDEDQNQLYYQSDNQFQKSPSNQSNQLKSFELREAEAVVLKILNEPGNIQANSILLNEFVKQKLRRKERMRVQLKNSQQEQAKEKRSNGFLSGTSQNQNDNELKQLFIKSVNEIRIDIMKRNNDEALKNNLIKNNNLNQIKFTKPDRLELMKMLLMSQRFIEIVKCKIFDEKCCNNVNCKFNFRETYLSAQQSGQNVLNSPNNKTIDDTTNDEKEHSFPPTSQDIIDQKLIDLIRISQISSPKQFNNLNNNSYNYKKLMVKTVNPKVNINDKNNNIELTPKLNYTQQFNNNRIIGTQQRSRRTETYRSDYNNKNTHNKIDNNNSFDRNKSFDINSYNDYQYVYNQDLTNLNIGLYSSSKKQSPINNIKMNLKQNVVRKIKENFEQQLVYMKNNNLDNPQKLEMQNFENQRELSSNDNVGNSDEQLNYQRKNNVGFQQGKIYVKDLSNITSNKEKFREIQLNQKKKQQIVSTRNWYQNYSDLEINQSNF